MPYKYFPQPYADDFGKNYLWVETVNNGIEISRMKKLVKDTYRLSDCDKCGCKLNYLGMGKYVCPECEEKYMDAVGIVNAAIEKCGKCSITELANITGLSIRLIRTLIEDGFISAA